MQKTLAKSELLTNVVQNVLDLESGYFCFPEKFKDALNKVMQSMSKSKTHSAILPITQCQQNAHSIQAIVQFCQKMAVLVIVLFTVSATTLSLGYQQLLSSAVTSLMKYFDDLIHSF